MVDGGRDDSMTAISDQKSWRELLKGLIVAGTPCDGVDILGYTSAYEGLVQTIRAVVNDRGDAVAGHGGDRGNVPLPHGYDR